MNTVCHDTEYCKHVLCNCIIQFTSLTAASMLVVFPSSSYRSLHRQTDYEPKLFNSCNTAMSGKCSQLCPWSEQFQEIWGHCRPDNMLSCSRVSLALRLTMNLKRLVYTSSPVHLKNEIHLLSFTVFPLQLGQTLPGSHFSPEKVFRKFKIYCRVPDI